ncbi:alanine racemase [Ruania halotolerans]|uniref:alanine racemase n=1 Tax=Ruania halotolerans TaxID=2897773 RepID=UPI001E2A78B3|nr:alanine racemase [Ruania halotolerans]UFU05469.1 alanine racemase [Ruania halotolerans]
MNASGSENPEGPDDAAVPDWQGALAEHLVRPARADKSWSPALEGWRPGTPGPPVSELGSPVVTLDVDALGHNLAAMASWARSRDVDLAPHGKTTMCPALWHWQVAAGARAITVANVTGARIAVDAGIERVVIANEVVDPGGLAELAGLLTKDPDLDLVCWVDSVAGATWMSEHLRAAGAPRPLGVCVEFGMAGGRSGASTTEAAIEVARAVRVSPMLALRGVSGYEGSSPAQSEADREQDAIVFLDQLAGLFLACAPLVEAEQPIFSAGGSMYFDHVADAAARIREVPGSVVLVRSGSSLIHDDGLFARLTPSTRGRGPELRAAAHVWSRVLSAPEPGRAILDAGRRDLPFDAGLPVPQRVHRARGDDTEQLSPNWWATAMNDQHLHLAGSGVELQIGDLVRLGISHPCTLLDKWRTVLLVQSSDDSGRSHVVGALATSF